MDNLPVSPVISPRILHRDRRAFLQTFAATLAVLPSARMQGEGRAIGPSEPGSRDQESLRIRQHAAIFESAQPVAAQFNDGDEANLPGYIGCFTKGSPHDSFVEVDTGAYQSLLQAISRGKQAGFGNIIRGSGTKLINPDACDALDLEGADLRPRREGIFDFSRSEVGGWSPSVPLPSSASTTQLLSRSLSIENKGRNS